MTLFKITYFIAVVLTLVSAKSRFPLRETGVDTNAEQSIASYQEVDESYRLPTDSVPTHYTIHLRTTVHEGTISFQGSVEISLNVVKETNKIVVNNHGLVIFSSILYRVQDKLLTEIDQPVPENDETRQLLTYNCAKQLEIGSYVLKVEYVGRMQTTSSTGFFRKYYRDENNRVHYIASTQFDPSCARMAFPCYDEPSLKATFTVSITHHNAFNAVSNMPVEMIEDTDDPKFKITTFKRTPIMSTYSLAFAVSEFETKTNGMQLIHARPNAIEETEFALEAGEKTLLELNLYTDISYYNYMPKLAQIAIPDWGSGSMENWGLVTYGEPALLFNPQVNTYRSKKGIATVIAHEYAHQWFGNLVTTDWWKYIWLNEGFATLYGYYGAHLAYPDQEYMDLFQLDVLHLALGPDSTESTRPMNWNAATPAEISALFDRVAYEKSGSVLNMFRTVFGDDNWRVGLKSYLLSRQLAAATDNDLYAALQSATEGKRLIPATMTVKEIMESWTNAAGYPVLNVRRNYASKELILSQDRFLADKKLPNDHVWYIPYNLADQRDPNFELNNFLWLTTKAAKVLIGTEPDHWLIFNRQQFGYYRVNYDSRNWEMLTEAMVRTPEAVHHYNRAQLIDDAFNLAKADLLDFGVVLRLLTSLTNDQDYLPWAAGNNVLTYLYNKLRGTDHYEGFVYYVHTLIGNIYTSLSVVTVGEQETLKQKYLKQLISTWACRIGYSECLDKTHEAFTAAIRDNTKVHPDVAFVVYCYGMQRATDQEFVAMYNRMFDSQNSAERTLLIDALGCSQSMNQLDVFLTSSIGFEVNDLQMERATPIGTEVNYSETERTRVLHAVYSASRTGVDALIEFLSDWNTADDLIYNLKQPAFNNAIVNIAARTNNEQELKQLKQLLIKVGALAPENVVNAALETVQSNLDWYSSLEGVIVAEFFEKYA